MSVFFVFLSIALSLVICPAMANASTSTNSTQERTVVTLDQSVAAQSAQTLTSQNSSDTTQNGVAALLMQGRVMVGSGTLNLIQGGNYDPGLEAKAVQKAASTMSSAEILKIKNRLNTAFMNPSSSSSTISVSLYDMHIPMSEWRDGNLKSWIEDVINSNPDLFYLGTSYNYQFLGYNGTLCVNTVSVSLSVSPSSVASMRNSYNTNLRNALSWIPANATDAQKARAAHDWLVRNCKYNTTVYNRLRSGDSNPSAWWYSTYKNLNPWTAYGALVTKEPVCEGYSLAFMAIMNKVDVDATFVTNMSAGHGWNRTKLGTSWYNLDITYDDPIPDKGSSTTPSTSWFLKSDTTFKKDSTHATWAPTGAVAYSDYNLSGMSTYSKAASGVTGTPTSLTLSPSGTSAAPYAMLTDSRVQLNVSLTGSGHKSQAIWTSSNPSVVSVNSTGLVTTGSKAGTASVTCKIGSRSTTAYFKVLANGTLLSSATVKLSASSFTHDGKSHKPTVTVTYGGKTLNQGSDYTVKFPSDVTSPGTKTITLTGAGNYVGTKTVTYQIKGSVALTTVTMGASNEVIAPVVKYGNTTLKQGTDYTVSYRYTSTSTAATATITGKGAWTGTRSVTYNRTDWDRKWGSAALDTMAAITKTFGTASIAVVATNTGFKDSLAAAALAGSLSAPMLTTSKGGLSAQTRNELNRMGVTMVYIVGKTSDVAGVVETQIKNQTKARTVNRISAANAAQTAIACANATIGRSDTVIIATQNNFKDALAISPYAYATKSPILYAETNKTLSSATLSHIRSRGYRKAIIVGGPVALPASIETQLKSAGISSANITRLAGSNQYKTAQVIAEWATGKLANGTGGAGLYQYANIKFQPSVKFTANKLGVARADRNDIGWKDALAGAALCGKNKSVLVLADANNSSHAAAFVDANKTTMLNAYIFGGTGAVPVATANALMAASL